MRIVVGDIVFIGAISVVTIDVLSDAKDIENGDVED